MKKIEQKLIESAIRVIKDGEGCLFVIWSKDLEADSMVPNDLREKFSIFDDNNQKRLDILAKVDGACIISTKGNLLSYGMRIKTTKILKGYGTRHSAAYSASLKGNTVILGSQENKKVRIFKEGNIVMQIDALEKGIEKKTSQAAGILESIGVGAIGTLAAGVVMPLGVALLPGIIVFGTSHWVLKYIMKEKQK